jgi:hypothetical protein
MFLRKVVLAFSAVALTVGGVLASGVAANAETTVDGDSSNGTVVASSVGVLGTLPSCAEYDGYEVDAWVINYCSYTIHAKILWSFASDTGCYELDPGESLSSYRPWPARFDGAVSC